MFLPNTRNGAILMLSAPQIKKKKNRHVAIAYTDSCLKERSIVYNQLQIVFVG